MFHCSLLSLLCSCIAGIAHLFLPLSMNSLLVIGCEYRFRVGKHSKSCRARLSTTISCSSIYFFHYEKTFLWIDKLDDYRPNAPHCPNNPGNQQQCRLSRQESAAMRALCQSRHTNSRLCADHGRRALSDSRYYRSRAPATTNTAAAALQSCIIG